jgi:hypothetical protein
MEENDYSREWVAFRAACRKERDKCDPNGKIGIGESVRRAYLKIFKKDIGKLSVNEQKLIASIFNSIDSGECNVSQSRESGSS